MSGSLKARLLKGAAHHEDLEVPELAADDFDGVVQVRPLTEGEQAEVEALAMTGQVVRGKVGERPTDSEVDVVASAQGQQRARRLRVAYGLSVDEKWSPADVAKLPPAAVTRISRKVRELTGGEGGLDDEAAAFRGDDTGSGDGGAAPDGDATGGDAG